MSGDPQEPQDDDYPMVACPKCGHEEPDMDGFGFIACPPPKGCGYCTHPSSSKPYLDKPWACGVCGQELPEPQGEKP